MAHVSGEGAWQGRTSPLHALSAAAPPLLFGLRMWASVCLALYVAFWLQLPNADWAGTTAFIVCQPQLGASMRKGWYRMVGTLIGAVVIVVVTALFIQERVMFLGALAIWGAACAFAATVLRNFASYAAALSGYTAVIVAADTLGATGGPGTDVFMLAVMRTSEICIGIVSAGVVLAGTDLGGSRRRLAAIVADLGTEIIGRFDAMLAQAGGQVPSTQAIRRELTRCVIALDPVIDQALGEASQLRYHSPVLQRAYHGLFQALDGWRCVETRLQQLPPDEARREGDIVRRNLPGELRAAPATAMPDRWTHDPLRLQTACGRAATSLHVLPAASPSLRLLADQTAKLLAGLADVLAGLALLVDAPRRPRSRGAGFKLSVPDFLPAAISAARAFLAIAAIELVWVFTAWPNGAGAILFAAVLVLLFSPRGEAAYASAIAFTTGIGICIVLTAIMKFVLLPELETFPELSAALGLYLVPVGFGLAYTRHPGAQAVLTGVGIGFIPLLQPANEMTYNTLQYYNSALALFAGSASAALAFALLPPPSAPLRTRRLLRFALADVQRNAIAHIVPASDDWERRMYGRLAALPDQPDQTSLAQLLAALAAGSQVIELRRLAAALPAGPELGAALTALARGDSTTTLAWLSRLDQRLAAGAGDAAEAGIALRARASILVLSEAVAAHPGYFGSGARR